MEVIKHIKTTNVEYSAAFQNKVMDFAVDDVHNFSKE